MAVKTYEGIYTDGCGSNSVSVSSPLRGVLQFFSGSTGVLSGKDWSPFRRGLGSPPHACPGIFPGMAREVRKQTRKKSSCLIPLIDIYLSVLPEKFLKKSVENVWKLCFIALLLHPLSRGKVTRTARHGDGPGRKKRKKTSEKVWQFRKKLLTFAVTFREGATREEIFERIFIPTKVVQVSRPDLFRIE